VKCIDCQNDAKYKERADGKCPKCGKPFAFEPRTGDPLTDAAFKSAIDRVSSDGTVHFTLDHVYWELARRRSKRSVGGAVFGGVLAVVCLLVAIGDAPAALIGTFIFGGLAVFCWLPGGSLERPVFDQLWQKWIRAKGLPAKLIQRKQLSPAKKERQLPKDIPAYSFDRAVICDRAETVDVLLANNFHFENNCAVLAVGGYPDPPFHTVRSMLKNNPKLVVYALHDASAEGCMLAHTLATSPEWFKGSSVRIVDVGLRPAQVGPLKRCWEKTDAPVTAGNGITPSEADWLSRYSLALAVIRPEQIIKRLFRAITGEPQKELTATSDGGLFFIDTTSFSADASSSDGGGDSFG
jgi:hypothetical protein